MYQELLVPIDNSHHSMWGVDRALELCSASEGQLTANHVYAARLHDVRFRQLETGLPAKFQTPDEIKRQRKIHDKLIEKGLQLISDSFLDRVGLRCEEAEVPMTRQLLEGINYEEIIREANEGRGRLPSLIGFDPNIAAGYDGGGRVRSDVRVGENGRLIAEEEELEEKLAGSSGRDYDLLVMGAHGIGIQPLSQMGGVASRVARGVEKDMLLIRDDRPLAGGRWIVCVDGSAYGYKAMRQALEMARGFGAKLFVCSAFDVEYHHAVFNNIKDVLSVQASRVFKFEEQEELHNNIIDKGLLKLAQANLKRATVMAEEYPDVELETQILIGKPFQVVMQWAEEVDPTLLVLARHGAHRIEGTEMGSQAENVLRLASFNVLLIGTTDVRPEEIPWIEEYVLEHAEYTPPGIPTVTSAWLDRAIQKLLPTHMQLIMGIGDAEEFALAEVKAEESMKRTVIVTADDDEFAEPMAVETRCPVTDQVSMRPRTEADPIIWTHEAFARLRLVPLIARPLARNTVESFARKAGLWRVTTRVMDENKQAMIEADEFDMDTMLVMFNELKAKQVKAEAAGLDGMSEEMRRFIDEAKASGVTRCPIRDVEQGMSDCPVDFKTATPEEARLAMESFMAEEETRR